MRYYRVPFFGNAKDDTHCVQAVLKMVLKYFLPKRNFDWKELDRISKKERNLGTWLVPVLIWFAKQKFDVINVEQFDYDRYYREGEPYIKKIFPKRAAEWYLKKSNLKSIKRRIPEFLRIVTTHKRYAKANEIRELLDRGYLVTSDVNSDMLNGKKGYNSHLVLIIGYEKNNFILHDPGLPPQKNHKVTSKLFQKAWSKKYKSGPNLTAFKMGK